MKKVVFLVQNNFLNESRTLKEAVSLKKNGYDVLVIALYEKGLKVKDIISGVDIKRMRLRTRFLPKYMIFKMIKYAEFCILIICKNIKCDVYHCHDLDTLPAAFILSILNRKARIVYDASEFAIENNSFRGFYKKIQMLVERLLIWKTDAVITVSNSIASSYASLYNIKKPYIVLNVPAYARCKKNRRFRQEFDIPDSKVILLYQGFLWPGRGIEKMIESLALIKSECCVVFMGSGDLVDYIRKKTEEYPGRVYYKPLVPVLDVLEHTSSADIGLCLTENVCLNHYYSLPNKLFQYIMAGLPVITPDFPEMARLVRHELDCGLVIDPASPTDIALKIDRLINNKDMFNKFRANAESAAKRYNWENEERVLLDIYDTLR